MEALSSKLAFDSFKKQIVFQTIIKNLIDTSSSTNNPTAQLANSIVDYMIDNFKELKSCKELKNVFHYSDDHITNLVKKHYGITPWQFVVRLRIEGAMDLLTNTNHTISYIASYIGYRDISVFYKAFKSYVLCSPKQWRNESRQL